MCPTVDVTHVLSSCWWCDMCTTAVWLCPTVNGSVSYCCCCVLLSFCWCHYCCNNICPTINYDVKCVLLSCCWCDMSYVLLMWHVSYCPTVDVTCVLLLMCPIVDVTCVLLSYCWCDMCPTGNVSYCWFDMCPIVLLMLCMCPTVDVTCVILGLHLTVLFIRNHTCALLYKTY